MTRLRLTTKHILADAAVGVENVVKMAYSERFSKQTQLSAQAEEALGCFLRTVQGCCSSHEWVLLSAIRFFWGKRKHTSSSSSSSSTSLLFCLEEGILLFTFHLLTLGMPDHLGMVKHIALYLHFIPK